MALGFLGRVVITAARNGIRRLKIGKAYRYVVDCVRARGASNIKWMFHTNNYPYPYEVWNSAAAYYPGSDYVDWLGLSVYGQQYKDEPNPDIQIGRAHV